MMVLMLVVKKNMRMMMVLLQCSEAEKRADSVRWKKSESGVGQFPAGQDDISHVCFKLGKSGKC